LAFFRNNGIVFLEKGNDAYEYYDKSLNYAKKLDIKDAAVELMEVLL